ncbi:uncharacterized protein F4822DRAFT_250583 [Hypoxylon trugodes]|uniref:uncharacterized protein n=1 Tax=Hypoxylon trugodes TaxID=326681 RepID=UPI002198F683|nr:uncharacterized protein F4822DRAFT_250583 [Hypoxylon trugodes]KAI1388578.1 hypothetical protein F4822DRAFT_250583 [Hypoxylon trugodes]
MRTSSFRRRVRANDLRISVRDDVPNTVEDSDLSDSDDEGEPDTPSPTTETFQSPTPAPTAPTESSTQQLGGITPTPSSSDPTEPTAISSSSDVLPAQTSSINVGVTQSTPPQTGETIQAQASQSGNEAPGRSRDGAIAVGSVGGAVVVAAIIFILWKWRRRRNRAGGSLYSESTSFSFFGRRKASPRPTMANYGPPGRTQSGIMDDLMAAAYAAEDGNASQYGGYTDEKQRMNASVYAPNPTQPPPIRYSGAVGQQTAVNSDRDSHSLYVNQLLSGFYKGSNSDGLAAPPGARVPPPAPSVAGRTEVTNTTETTWKTWGWEQKKPQKETWVDKCIRLGGLK